MTQSSNGPRRQLLRFSLRSLLILVVVIAMPLAWKVNRVRNQRLVRAEVERLNGQVQFDYEWQRLSAPPGPAWLRNFLGDDYFENVVWINLRGLPATDETISLAVKLPYLETLNIVSDEVSDAGVRQLVNAPRLRMLQLGSRRLTDEGLASLQNLPHLKSLDLILADAQITDTALAQIAAITQLDDLNFEATNISRDNLAHVLTLPKLKQLSINCPLTDDDLSNLELGNVPSLTLQNTKITDKGLAHVARLKRLKLLFIFDSQISDDGLAKLESMTNLRLCLVRNTKATAQGEARLKRALPKCNVSVE